MRLEQNTGGIRIGKTLYMVQGVELQVAEGGQSPADRVYISPGVRNAAGYLPLPLHDERRQVMGVAVPVDVWGIYGGQPLARARIVAPNSSGLCPVDVPGNDPSAGGNVWIDPVSGVAVARLTDEEMNPDTDENGNASAGET